MDPAIGVVPRPRIVACFSNFSSYICEKLGLPATAMFAGSLSPRGMPEYIIKEGKCERSQNEQNHCMVFVFF
jgi:hypothetical protein